MMTSKNEKNQFVLLYDAECKDALSKKRALAITIKTFIPEFKDLDYESIEKCIEGYSKDSDTIKSKRRKDDDLKDSTVIYDLLYNVKYPNSGNSFDLIINIEPQGNISSLEYPLVNRAIYYACRLLTTQKNKPINKREDKIGYKDLKKVYSIWLCVDPYSGKNSYISLFDINKTKLFGNYKDDCDYKLTNVIIVNIGKDIERIINDKTNEFCYFFKLISLLITNGGLTQDERAETLENEYDILVKKEGINKMHFAQDQLDAAFGAGIKQGTQQGLSQGIQQGHLSALVLSINKMMSSLKMSFDEASEVLTLDDETKDKVLKELNKKDN